MRYLLDCGFETHHPELPGRQHQSVWRCPWTAQGTAAGAVETAPFAVYVAAAAAGVAVAIAGVAVPAEVVETEVVAASSLGAVPNVSTFNYSKSLIYVSTYHRRATVLLQDLLSLHLLLLSLLHDKLYIILILLIFIRLHAAQLLRRIPGHLGILAMGVVNRRRLLLRC